MSEAAGVDVGYARIEQVDGEPDALVPRQRGVQTRLRAHRTASRQVPPAWPPPFRPDRAREHARPAHCTCPTCAVSARGSRVSQSIALDRNAGKLACSAKFESSSAKSTSAKRRPSRAARMSGSPPGPCATVASAMPGSPVAGFEQRGALHQNIAQRHPGQERMRGIPARDARIGRAGVSARQPGDSCADQSAAQAPVGSSLGTKRSRTRASKRLASCSAPGRITSTATRGQHAQRAREVGVAAR